jgi:hypothetical protein
MYSGLHVCILRSPNEYSLFLLNCVSVFFVMIPRTFITLKLQTAPQRRTYHQHGESSRATVLEVYARKGLPFISPRRHILGLYPRTCVKAPKKNILSRSGVLYLIFALRFNFLGINCGIKLQHKNGGR